MRGCVTNQWARMRVKQQQIANMHAGLQLLSAKKPPSWPVTILLRSLLKQVFPEKPNTVWSTPLVKMPRWARNSHKAKRGHMNLPTEHEGPLPVHTTQHTVQLSTRGTGGGACAWH